MIFTPHVIIGAVIGAKTHNLGLIIILGIFSHAILDHLPHWDYTNNGIRNFYETKDFKALFIDLFRIALDGLLALVIILVIIFKNGLFDSDYIIFIILGIFFSILPDILLFTAVIFRGKFGQHLIDFHQKFLHTKKEKEGKITFLNISTEILVIIISIIILFS